MLHVVYTLSLDHNMQWRFSVPSRRIPQKRASYGGVKAWHKHSCLVAMLLVNWPLHAQESRWRLRRPTSVDHEPGLESSGQSRLLDSYPNPFNAGTTIGFELDRRQAVSLSIHNTTGQRVTTLAEGVYPEGEFAVCWDGRDDHGREVASGVYMCRLRLAKQALAHPLTLVRWGGRWVASVREWFCRHRPGARNPLDFNRLQSTFAAVTGRFCPSPGST